MSSWREAMSQSQPQTAVRVLPHKPCPRCHDVMRLAVVRPEGEGLDRRIFQCRGCGHSDAGLFRHRWTGL
jgi:hypothetical protein